jgi:integrase
MARVRASSHEKNRGIWKERNPYAMAIRMLNRLDPRRVDAVPEGTHGDGAGLFLSVRDGGRLRSWMFRYSIAGRIREMGLGKAGRGGVDLKAARVKRDELRALIDQGLDPLAERKTRQAEQSAKKTFGEVAAIAIENRRRGWKGTSSLDAWTRTMDDAKALDDRPVDEITVDEIKRVIAPLWEAGLSTQGRPRKGGLTAARLSLARIAIVFDVARAHGWRSADNPAAWATFKHILPEGPKGEKHHSSIDWRDAPAFMARLRESASMSALALEFAILTGVRLGEAIEATWDEINFGLWTIPGERMKRATAHVVPLSGRALAIVNALQRHAQPGSKIIFRGGLDGRGGPILRQTVYDQAMRVSGGKASVHGWRATLRSWMADHSVSFETAEAVLAHSKGGTVAAYQRSQLIELRRPVMERWAQYLSGEEPGTAEIIPLSGRYRRA